MHLVDPYIQPVDTKKIDIRETCNQILYYNTSVFTSINETKLPEETDQDILLRVAKETKSLVAIDD